MIETTVPPVVETVPPVTADGVAPPVMELIAVPPPEPHLLMSTNFADYTVSEGLLLLIFLSLVVALLGKLIREVF